MAAVSAQPETQAYRGRFAPSPTGPLHFGSLVAALGSCLDARHHQGQWLLRMEDVDQPRCSSAMAATILRQLETYGFEWDEKLIWQSQRTAAYQAALEQLKQQQKCYPCACSRSELHAQVRALDGHLIYPGTCRQGLPAGRSARAWRLRVEDRLVVFADALQGSVRQQLAIDVGDFVLLRADGLFAYQLAVVVDDAAQGITHVVRGADLLDSTARQIHLQHCLGLATPAYMHLPLAVQTNGEKLSKQTQAAALPVDDPRPWLVAALNFLGQAPPPELRAARLDELWQWARSHWQRSQLPHAQKQEGAAFIRGD